MGNTIIKNLVRQSNPANIAMASTFVKEAIAKDKVVIFSKSHCPYCKMAKEVSRMLLQMCEYANINKNIVFSHLLQQFQQINHHFTAIELENRDDCQDIQAALGEITGGTTVNQRNFYSISC